MVHKLETEAERDMGIWAGQKVFDLMYELNLANHYPLAVDSGHPDAVYSHLYDALNALFRQLGVVDVELAREVLRDTSNFRDAVTAAKSSGRQEEKDA